MSLKIIYWTLTLLFVLSLGLTFELPARAYTDPGSCLLLFQGAGAVASGLLFYFRRHLKRLFLRGTAAKVVASHAFISRDS